ncbi:MAG: sigma-70 family RNA polymerase sigma factor, partial [Gaiellaceae bacterium]
MTPLLITRRGERGFERLYQRHVKQVYRYVFAVLEHQADAEDATQQTFLGAYRAWQRGERPRQPHNWLIAIAHNVCRQRFRESSRRPSEVVLDEAVLAGAGAPSDDTPRAGDIRQALRHLGFNQRAAIVMRELEGRSYDEIAGVLGVSHGAVETLLFRARRALREQLEGDLTCGDAEEALSRQLDGRLERSERATLRAHLRECRECAALERSNRSRRAAVRGLAFPLPASLTAFSTPQAATVGASAGLGLLAKGLAAVAVGLAIQGTGERVLRNALADSQRTATAATESTAAASATPARSAPRIRSHGAVTRAPAKPVAATSRAGGQAAAIDTPPATSSTSAAATQPTPEPAAAAPVPVTAPQPMPVENAPVQAPPVLPPVKVPPVTVPAPPSVSVPAPPSVSVPAPPSVSVPAPPSVSVPAPPSVSVPAPPSVS